MKTQVIKLGGKWTKTHHENFQAYNEANPGMAIDTNDIKCEYTLRETEFHTAAFLNGQQKIDLTTPFNGKAEHKMGDINFSSLTQTSPNHINQMFFDKNGVVQKTVDIKISQDGKLVVAETANGVTLFTYFNKA